jgi:hypothetical protein
MVRRAYILAPQSNPIKATKMVTFANRAKVSTATTGAGTITLGAAELRSQTFGGAGLVDGDVVRYTIEDGNNFEIGTGTYTASGTTLTRVPYDSSNGGAAINLSGVAVVFVTVAAEDLAGALNALVFDTRALAEGATIKPTANMIWVGTAAGSYLCFEPTAANPALTTNTTTRLWRPARAFDSRLPHWGVGTYATKPAALAALDAMSGAERTAHQTALEAAFLHTSGVLLIDGWVEAIDEVVVGNACTPDLLGGIAGEQLIGGIFCGSRFNLLADSVVTAGATGVGSYAPYIKAMSIALDQSAAEAAAQVAYDAAIAGAPGDVPAAVAAGITAFDGAIIDYPKPFVGKEAFGLLETTRVTGMTKPTTWIAPTFTPGSGNLDNIGGWEAQNLQLSGYNQRLRIENGFHFLKVGRIDDWVWDLGPRAQDYRNRDITAGVKSEAIYFGRLDSLIVDHIGIFAAGQIVIDKGEGASITDQIGTVQLDGHFSSLTLRSGRTQIDALYGTEDVSAASLPHKILCESGTHIIASGSLLGNSDALIKVTGGRLEYDGIIRNTNINGHGGLVTAGQLVFDGAHFVVGVVGSFDYSAWNVGYLEQSGTGELTVTANCTAEQFTGGGVVQGPSISVWQFAKVIANNSGCNVLPSPRRRVDMVQALSGSLYNLYPIKGSQVYTLDGVDHLGVGGATAISGLPGLVYASTSRALDGVGTYPTGTLAGRPAAIAIGDSTTGMAQNGAGNLELWSSNVVRFSYASGAWDLTGALNVLGGINVSANIYSVNNTTDLAIFGGTDTLGASTILYGGANATLANQWRTTAARALFRNMAGDILLDMQGTAETVAFTQGQVGLGVVPTGLMASRAAALAIGDSTTGIAQNGAGVLEFFSQNVVRMSVAAGVWDINGTLRVSGNLEIAGNVYSKLNTDILAMYGGTNGLGAATLLYGGTNATAPNQWRTNSSRALFRNMSNGVLLDIDNAGGESGLGAMTVGTRLILDPVNTDGGRVIWTNAAGAEVFTVDVDVAGNLRFRQGTTTISQISSAGHLSYPGVIEYASDAAANTGGVPLGAFYVSTANGALTKRRT